MAPQSNSLRDPVVVFWVFNTLTSLCLGVSSTLLPKRPDVFFNGCKIDRQRTVSLLSRYTWSWIQPLLLHASTMNDLDMDVIPSADRTLRSRELKKDWDALKIQTSLLRSLWWAYKGRLATLWTVTIVRCLVGIVPFWTMLRILNRLEIRRDSGCHNFELMALVIGMALSNLLDAVRTSVFSLLQVPYTNTSSYCVVDGRVGFLVFSL